MSRVIPSRLIPTRNSALAVLIISALAGAWAGIFGRIGQQEHIPTTVIIAARMTLGALALTPFVIRNYWEHIRALTRRDILFTAIVGFWFALHLYTGFATLEHTTVLVGAVIGGTSPLWIALIEVTFLRARLRQMVWFGLLVTLSGGIIIALASGSDMSLGDNPSLGIALALGAALAGSVYSILGGRARVRIPALMPYMWLVFTFGGLFMLIVVVLTRAPITGYSAKGYFSLIMLTLVPQLIGHSAYNYALRRLPASYCSVVGQLGVVITGILALLIFHEVPGALQLPGSLAIIIGITLVNFGQSKKPEAERPPAITATAEIAAAGD